MSVTSEPAVETLSALGPMRPRTCSEGASPSITPTEEVRNYFVKKRYFPENNVFIHLQLNSHRDTLKSQMNLTVYNLDQQLDLQPVLHFLETVFLLSGEN